MSRSAERTAPTSREDANLGSPIPRHENRAETIYDTLAIEQDQKKSELSQQRSC